MARNLIVNSSSRALIFVAGCPICWWELWLCWWRPLGRAGGSLSISLASANSATIKDLVAQSDWDSFFFVTLSFMGFNPENTAWFSSSSGLCTTILFSFLMCRDSGDDPFVLLINSSFHSTVECHSYLLVFCYTSSQAAFVVNQLVRLGS